MRAKSKRPEKIRRPLPDGTHQIARPVRHRTEDGRWYWRVERHAFGATVTEGCGWWHPHEVATALESGHALTGGAKKRSTRREARDDEATLYRHSTIGELLRAYQGTILEVDKAIEDSSRAAYISAVRRLLRDKDLVGVRMDRCTTSTWVAWRDRAAASGLSASTIITTMAVMRKAWTWVHEHGLVDAPWAVVRVKRPKARHPSAPRATEILPRLRQIPDWPGVALRLQAALGARAGEVWALRPTDIEVRGEVSIVTLGRHEGARKTGTRQVPVWDQEIRAELQALVLGSTDLAAGMFPVSLKGFMSRLGTTLARWLPGVRTHDLRRMMTSRLYDAGVDPAVAGRLLGHSPEIAMRHYRAIEEEGLAEAMRRVSGPSAMVIRLQGG